MNEIINYNAEFNNQIWVNSPKIDANFQIKNIPSQFKYYGMAKYDNILTNPSLHINVWFVPKMIIVDVRCRRNNLYQQYFSEFSSTHKVLDNGTIENPLEQRWLNFRRWLSWNYVLYKTSAFMYIRTDWNGSTQDATFYWLWVNPTGFSIQCVNALTSWGLNTQFIVFW